MKPIKYCTRAELKNCTLAFGEKFTILHKVTNTLNIGLNVRKFGLTALIIAITLLISASTLHPRFKGVVVSSSRHGGLMTEPRQDLKRKGSRA